MMRKAFRQKLKSRWQKMRNKMRISTKSEIMLAENAQSMEKIKSFLVFYVKLVWEHFQKYTLMHLAIFTFILTILLLLYLETTVGRLGFALAKKDLNPRDFGLLFFGLFSPSFALMGFHFSNRRNQASDKQNQLQSEQNQLQSERNRNDVFAKTVQLLGSKNLYQRLGAIAALRQIGSAQNSPFATDIITILEDFIRSKTKEATPAADENNDDEKSPVPAEVNRAFQALCNVIHQQRKQGNIDISADLSRRDLHKLQARGITIPQINLSGTTLSGADLSDAILSRAILWNANLSRAILWNANLSGANLHEANLSGAHLTFPIARGLAANLSDATITDADFQDCKHLTVAQIQSAKWYKNYPPRNLPSEIADHPDFVERLLTLEALCKAQRLTKKQVEERGIPYRKTKNKK